MFAPVKDITSDGYDLQFGTNVIGGYFHMPLYNSQLAQLGHFYLTKLLLPLLRAAAKSSPDGKARIITVSSLGHMYAPNGGLDYATLKDGPQRRKMSTFTLYFQSKFVCPFFHRNNLI